MGIDWTADTMGSIPNGVSDWTLKATSCRVVIMSSLWACFTNILCRIPNQRSHTKNAFLCSWIQVAAIWANTDESLEIINESFSTGYANFISRVPIFR